MSTTTTPESQFHEVAGQITQQRQMAQLAQMEAYEEMTRKKRLDDDRRGRIDIVFQGDMANEPGLDDPLMQNFPSKRDLAGFCPRRRKLEKAAISKFEFPTQMEQVLF